MEGETLMSIDRVNISNQGIDRSQAAQQVESTRTSGKDKKVSTGSDSVAVSSKATEINRLANQIDQSRTERFNKVRAELEAGKYQVSAGNLAQKLIDTNRK
jgi:flagellar biosynthesis anti-sigma factor FlgM